MPRLTKIKAQAILIKSQAIPLDATYHELRQSQVHWLLHFADERQYRQSRMSNGCRARGFFNYVKAVANSNSVSQPR